MDHVEIEKKTKVEVPGYDKPVTFGLIFDFAYKLSDGSGNKSGNAVKIGVVQNMHLRWRFVEAEGVICEPLN